MIIPFAAMTVTRRFAYPGCWPMYTVRFIAPTAPGRAERVTTRIKGVPFAGPIIGYDKATGECEAQLYHAPQEQTAP